MVRRCGVKVWLRAVRILPSYDTEGDSEQGMVNPTK